MKLTKMIAGVALMAMLAVVLAPVASAQPNHLQPGSVLIYPLYDATAGAGTVICLTNTNDDNVYCPSSDFRAGDVNVHYQYIDGDTWEEFDRFELLTPGDTLCVLVDQHNPEGNQGFLVVSAADPQDMNKKIDFDYLIGSAVVVQSGLNFLWSYTPYAFEGLPSDGAPSACDRYATDDDSDGALDFDGTEYDLFPKQVFIDSFFQETGSFGNALTLMTTTGANYDAEVDFLFWNNIEEKFSRSFRFTCWHTGPLSEISAIVTRLGGDAEELGFNEVETGWASITGARTIDGAGNPVMDGSDFRIPPVLGVFNQLITSTDFSAGHALHYRGSLDGLELLTGNDE